MKKIIMLLLLPIVFNTCDEINTVEKINDEIAINLILKTDSEKQVALLSNILNPDEETYDFRFIDKISLIDSADFSVNHIPFENIPFDSLKNNLDCTSNFPKIDKCFNYFSNDSNLINNGLNTLQIKIDNKNITGKTTMPGNFSVTIKNKKISWSPSSNTFLYRISVIPQNTQYIERFEKTTNDTTIILDIEDFVPDTYIITIEALDKNLYNFMYKHKINEGLQNAYGVFGSVRTKHLVQIIN